MNLLSQLSNLHWNPECLNEVYLKLQFTNHDLWSTILLLLQVKITIKSVEKRQSQCNHCSKTSKLTHVHLNNKMWDKCKFTKIMLLKLQIYADKDYMRNQYKFLWTKLENLKRSCESQFEESNFKKFFLSSISRSDHQVSLLKESSSKSKVKFEIQLKEWTIMKLANSFHIKKLLVKVWLGANRALRLIWLTFQETRTLSLILNSKKNEELSRNIT